MSGAEYQRQYRAEASLAWKEKENRRSRAWWKAHRELAKKFPAEFRELYETQKRLLEETEARQ
jgi:hypothetical protein